MVRAFQPSSTGLQPPAKHSTHGQLQQEAVDSQPSIPWPWCKPQQAEVNRQPSLANLGSLVQQPTTAPFHLGSWVQQPTTASFLQDDDLQRTFHQVQNVVNYKACL